MSFSFLQNFGLTKTEVDLYELRLQIGQSPVSRIVKETKLKRPTVYNALYAMERKGLVSKKELYKKIHFRPQPPVKLLTLAEEAQQSVKQARENLQASISYLSSLYVRSVEQPVVQVYEGVDGLKEIYLDILKEAKSGYSILQTEDMDPTLVSWLTTYFLRGRIKRKMHLKTIIAGLKGTKQFTKRDIAEYRISAVVPPKSFPFQHEVTIYGDKVAFLHYKKGDALIGVVIKHVYIAQTMKAWFDLAWEGAQRYKQY